MAAVRPEDRLRLIQMQGSPAILGKPVAQQAMVDSLIADGWTPEEAKRIAENDARVTGGTPQALFDANQSPQMQAARRQRVQDQRAAEARQGRFEANYNAATGAPGWGYNAQGVAGRMEAPVEPKAEPPMDPALSKQSADRARTQGQMDEMIAAGRRGQEVAESKGFKDQPHMQDRGTPRNILRRKWAEEQQARFGGSVEAYYDLYDKYAIDGEGNLRDHRGTQRAIADAGALDLARSKKKEKLEEVPLRDRQQAVRARADQDNMALRLGVPVGKVVLAQGRLGARTPFDLVRHAAADQFLDPQGGGGNLAMGLGAEVINAEAVAGLGDANKTPMDRMREDQERNVASRPIGERAQAYRQQHASLNAGQPANPEAENLHLVQAGAGDASGAASLIISGNAKEGEENFLREWTLAFISREGVGSTGFQKWASRLGIPPTEEAMALWHKMTNTSGRTWVQAIGEGLGFNPVPSVRDMAPKPAAATPPQNPVDHGRPAGRGAFRPM